MVGGIRYDPLPLGIRCLKRCSGSKPPNNNIYKGWILILTFLIYMTYHMNRKCPSVVKKTLHGNTSNDNDTGWYPFNKEDGNKLLGYLDTALLLSYAIAIFFWGHVADGVSLRYFLTAGMLATSVSGILYGMAQFWNIHELAYFVIMMMVVGTFQATGWPAVVAVVGNWVSKGSRGLVMGVWNSHTSVGNILGNIIAGTESNSVDTWGLSFVYPAIIMALLAVVVFFFLPTTPQSVNLPPPNQASKDEDEERLIRSIQVGNESDDDDGEDVDPNSIPAIGFGKALMLPGVLEFSFSLFFAKLVCYTFLFCLPQYIAAIEIGGKQYKSDKASDVSSFYDIGGIIGSIVCGILADKTGCNAIVCIIFQIASVPLLLLYYMYGGTSMAAQIGVMCVLGFFSNGPYALITTAVSADLGTQEAIRGSAQALATVSAIIDGIGSVGATIGPYLTSSLIGDGDASHSSYKYVFTMLMAASFVSALCLVRLFIKDVRQIRTRRIVARDVLSRTPTPSYKQLRDIQ